MDGNKFYWIVQSANNQTVISMRSTATYANEAFNSAFWSDVL